MKSLRFALVMVPSVVIGFGLPIGAFVWASKSMGPIGAAFCGLGGALVGYGFVSIWPRLSDRLLSELAMSGAAGKREIEEACERLAQMAQARRAEISAKLDDTRAQGTYPEAFVRYLADDFKRLSGGMARSEGEDIRRWIVQLATNDADSTCVPHLNELYKKLLHARSEAAQNLAIARSDPAFSREVSDMVRLESYETLLQEVEQCRERLCG